MRAYELECVIVTLERAREHAVSAGLDEHFVSDIDHLIATAAHNRTEDERT